MGTPGVRACVRVCVRACVHACVCINHSHNLNPFNVKPAKGPLEDPRA